MRPVDESRLDRLEKYIKRYQIDNGRAPTYRQIQEGLSYQYLTSVSRDVAVLKRRGVIEVNEEGPWKGIGTPAKLKSGQTVKASLLGTCACGEPTEALEDIVFTCALPSEIFGNGPLFMLQAKGRSMIDCGIHHGDLMVVRCQSSAEPGEIVIARMHEGEDATAKMLSKDASGYYLRPANEEVDENGERLYHDIRPDGDWQILGKVIQVIHAPMYEPPKHKKAQQESSETEPEKAN